MLPEFDPNENLLPPLGAAVFPAGLAPKRFFCVALPVADPEEVGCFPAAGELLLKLKPEGLEAPALLLVLLPPKLKPEGLEGPALSSFFEPKLKPDLLPPAAFPPGFEPELVPNENLLPPELPLPKFISVSTF